MPEMPYYVGRGLQLLGMAALLESILIAGPLGPVPGSSVSEWPPFWSATGW